MSQFFNVLLVMEMNSLEEATQKEILDRFAEHGLEKIPTLSAIEAWEIKVEAEDESLAKDKAIQEVYNVCRTYPFELKMVVQCGTGQILRRKKAFEA